MNRVIIILFIFYTFSSCESGNQTERITDSIGSDEKILTYEQIIDLYCDTVINNGKSYTGCNDYQTNFYIIDENNDTIYKHDEWINSFEFTDFNNDGLYDVLLGYLTNVGGVYDLALFDNEINKFKLVENFKDFPDPKRIDTTGFYYSYHKSGCADNIWDSDLFVINDFYAVKIGNIYGNGCFESGEIKIFITKINGYKKKIIKEILIEPGNDFGKWDFIEGYWTKNYNKFR